MNPNKIEIDRRFWIRWLLASALGCALGAAIGAAIAESIPSPSCTMSSEDTILDRMMNFPCMLPVAANALLGAFVGLGAGFMEWLVLRRQITRAGGWVLASTAGFAIAVVASETMGTALATTQDLFPGGIPLAPPIVTAILFGIAGSFLPWLMLRRVMLHRQVGGCLHSPLARWWVELWASSHSILWAHSCSARHRLP